MRHAALGLLLVLAAASVAAQQPSLADYHVVLVPVFFFGDGAHGSHWETVVAAAGTGENEGDLAVPLFEELGSTNCGTPDGRIQNGVTRHICRGYASQSGLLLYVPKTLDLLDVNIQARIRDLSRQAASAGTEIPVVRESDFRTNSFLLLDIPSDARFRSNLRLYGGLEVFSEDFRFVHQGGIGALVQIYDSKDLIVPLVETSVELAPAEAIDGTTYYTHPAFASIGDLVAAYPQLASVEKYSIRITAEQSIIDPPREFSVWGFVTITNNDTQEVTTVSP